MAVKTEHRRSISGLAQNRKSQWRNELRSGEPLTAHATGRAVAGRFGGRFSPQRFFRQWVPFWQRTVLIHAILRPLGAQTECRAPVRCQISSKPPDRGERLPKSNLVSRKQRVRSTLFMEAAGPRRIVCNPESQSFEVARRLGSKAGLSYARRCGSPGILGGPYEDI